MGIDFPMYFAHLPGLTLPLPQAATATGTAEAANFVKKIDGLPNAAVTEFLGTIEPQ